MSDSDSSVVTVEPRKQLQAHQEHETHASSGDSRTLMLMIERAVMQPDFDVGKLERLIALKEKWDANEARRAYTAAMAEFKRDPPKVYKDAHVAFTTSKGTTEYNHTTLGALCDAVIKGLAEVGISHQWNMGVTPEKRIQVTCVLTHKLGHKEEFPSIPAMPDDSGGKNAIQANQSTVTYLQRSTLFAATGLAPLAGADNDGRDHGTGSGDPLVGADPQYISLDQQTVVKDLLKQAGNEAGFWAWAKTNEWLKCSTVETIPAVSYQYVVDTLNAKISKKSREQQGQHAPGFNGQRASQGRRP